MNIALIVIDTLRYDYIGANGNTWIETPNIDRFAAKAWAFDRAFCASFPTIPYRTDVITGQYGGPFHPWQPLRHERQTLPSDAGRTRLCHATDPRYPTPRQRRTQLRLAVSRVDVHPWG